MLVYSNIHYILVNSSSYIYSTELKNVNGIFYNIVHLFTYIYTIFEIINYVNSLKPR